MDAYDVKVEWDEDGCYVIVDGPSLDPEYQAGEYRFRVDDPEQLYDRVKAAIGPWLRERDEARTGANAWRYVDAEGYLFSDPKHPDYHSLHADLWDNREGK